MPRALALETSGRIGSVALIEDEQIVASESFAHGLQHAATILPMIDRLTRARGWRSKDIEHVYVSVGPGSFTGLRIGVTLAKTLSLSIGAKIVPVPSARVLLLNLPDEAREAIIVLDAKRGQIFTARYSRDSLPVFEGSEVVSRTPIPVIGTPPHPSPLPAGEGTGDWREIESEHLDTLNAILGRAGRPVHLIGEGIPYHRQSIPDNPQIVVTDEPLWRARAEAVAIIGIGLAKSQDFCDPLKLTPIYVRLPEAEEKRLIEEEKRGNTPRITRKEHE